MREEALRQAKVAFAEGREDIFSAIDVIYDVLQYTIKESPIALAKEESFRQGEPYILDTLEGAGKKVPLKKYLAFGLDRISYGDEPITLCGFLENKYYANAYVGKDAYICFLYLIGIIGISQGQSWEDILGYFRTIILDEEEEAFDAFAAKWKFCGKSAKKIGTVIRFGQKEE